MSSPFLLPDSLFVCMSMTFQMLSIYESILRLGPRKAWKEYSCQEKETNFILLNHQVSQNKLQLSSCKKVQTDKRSTDLVLYKCSLPDGLSDAICLWSWPNLQWKPLFLGNILPSSFAPEQPCSGGPDSDGYVNVQLIEMLTYSRCSSLSWVTLNPLHRVYASPNTSSAFRRQWKSRAIEPRRCGLGFTTTV